MDIKYKKFKINQGDKDFANGYGEKMTIDELNSLWK